MIKTDLLQAIVSEGVRAQNGKASKRSGRLTPERQEDVALVSRITVLITSGRKRGSDRQSVLLGPVDLPPDQPVPRTGRGQLGILQALEIPSQWQSECCVSSRFTTTLAAMRVASHVTVVSLGLITMKTVTAELSTADLGFHPEDPPGSDQTLRQQPANRSAEPCVP